ncbi:MAG: hypothetical protein MZU97_07010 [Bacillus subtilis]|nr:hypothetical protein [Bacillus subtilis]
MTDAKTLPETKRRIMTADRRSIDPRIGKKVVRVSPSTAASRARTGDGTNGTGGCAYCSLAGSGDFAGDRNACA